jgi:hypothetical protein
VKVSEPPVTTVVTVALVEFAVLKYKSRNLCKPATFFSILQAVESSLAGSSVTFPLFGPGRSPERYKEAIKSH